jgi:hypothetical protein
VFAGQRGTGIPYGEYTVSVSCADGRGAGGTVLIWRPDALVIAAKFQEAFHADYPPGGAPVLRVKVSKSTADASAGTAWVKLIGVYLNYVDVGQFDSGEASFVNIQEGRYIFVLLRASAAACTKQVDVLKPDAILTFDPAKGCSLVANSGAKVID